MINPVLVLKPQPKNFRDPDGVYLIHPDGAYLTVEGERAQIFILGPMPFAPVEYLTALRHETQRFFTLTSAEFLPGESGNLALLRGCISLMFETDKEKS